MDEAPALREARTHATDRVPFARPDESVASVRDRLIGARFDFADDVAVVRDRALVEQIAERGGAALGGPP